MRVLTCPQHIHDVYASFRNGRHTRHRLSKRKFSQHMTCAVSHSVQNATSELQKLCNLIKSYAETHPTVQGSERLLKRAQSDFVFVRKLRDCSQQSNFSPPQFSTAAGQDGSLSRQLQEEQLQGVFNNIRGMKAEFAVAQQAPGVTCLGTRFYAEVSAGDSTILSTSRKAARAAMLANHFVPAGESVEVDVVAQQGLAWIEVKAYEPFDLDSTQWLGNPGHFKGDSPLLGALLQQGAEAAHLLLIVFGSPFWQPNLLDSTGLELQALQQVRVAQSPCQRLRWQQPAVVFHFPQGVHADVRQRLQEMGVLVSGPGDFCSSVLPTLPPLPAVCNLDVTTMCALVSEVSNGDPTRPELQQWAERVAHWKECLAGEVQQPMLPLLEPILAHTTIIAAQSAVQQFEKLLGQFGGCSEHLRWQGLLSKLTVFTDAHKEPEISTQTSRSGTNAGTTSTVQHVLFSESRVSSLQAISAAQRQVFALGDLQHAMTLTANGKAADFSARQGVKLEVFVHRAVWLTGM